MQHSEKETYRKCEIQVERQKKIERAKIIIEKYVLRWLYHFFLLIQCHKILVITLGVIIITP